MDRRKFDHEYRNARHAANLAWAAFDAVSSSRDKLDFLRGIIESCEKLRRLIQEHPKSDVDEANQN